MKEITVAELIEQLKKLPQDMIVIREEVEDYGWREEVPVQEAVIVPRYDTDAYTKWCRTKNGAMTPETHCVTLN